MKQKPRTCETNQSKDGKHQNKVCCRRNSNQCALSCHVVRSGLTSRAQARGTNWYEPRSGTGTAIPRCLQRFVRPQNRHNSICSISRISGSHENHHKQNAGTNSCRHFGDKKRIRQSSVLLAPNASTSESCRRTHQNHRPGKPRTICKVQCKRDDTKRDNRRAANQCNAEEKVPDFLCACHVV